MGAVAARLQQKILSVQDTDKMLRLVASNALPEVAHRIHVEGKDASGSEIGTYSPGYMSVRTKKYNRTGDTKVILSATRKMENEFVVVADGNKYGLGFLTPDSAQKARWCEETYDKKIYALTTEEKTSALTTAKRFVSDAIHR